MILRVWKTKSFKNQMSKNNFMVNSVVHSAHLTRSQNRTLKLQSDKNNLFYTVGNVDSKLILLITLNIDVLISLCDSWWFIMETIMKYININISYYFSFYLACFASLAELYCSIFFLFALLLHSLIRKAPTEMNGIQNEFFFKS